MSAIPHLHQLLARLEKRVDELETRLDQELLELEEQLADHNHVPPL